MEGKNRTFKQLQKEKNLQDLNEFAKQVTETYASTPLEYSQTNASADNHLTKKGLRDLMDYAIVTALVSRETASKILEKTIQNQQRKTQDAGSSSIQHHQKIIRLREKYLSDNYSRIQIHDMAISIAASNKPLSYFAKKYNLESDGVIKWMLERAIVEDIVSDYEMEAIIERSLKSKRSEGAKCYFQNLRKKRAKFKEENSQ